MLYIQIQAAGRVVAKIGISGRI
ncbi:hypothetical protein RSK20926_11984 [Roseobacter sp. SK209-2-6]|nr:hypothetical protein RSK20926_11984 [Roseobacter sp. SK209-2-6]